MGKRGRDPIHSEELPGGGRRYAIGKREGEIRPYRPCPADFRERFLEMGWDGIVDHYRTNWRCIRRWIEEAGGEALRAERRALTGAGPRPQLRTDGGKAPARRKLHLRP